MGELNRLIFETAGEYLGLEEFPGAKHNAQIVKMFADVGHSWVKDDETPWCAAFVGAVLVQLGLPQTGGLNAKSYLDWGYSVPLSAAEQGDVVVLWRINRDGPYGHCAFYAGRTKNGDVVLRGGNQGNKVSDAVYPLNRVLQIRRIEQPKKPSMKMESKSQFRKDLENFWKKVLAFFGISR